MPQKKADYSIETDAELILLLKAEDQTAYTEIYRRYYYLMFTFAFKKFRDEDQAKDIVQDLFTSLWHKRESIQIKGSIPAYLYVSLRNQILNSITHDKVKQKYIDSLQEYMRSANTATTDHLIRERQLQSYIDKQIESLPKKMRRVFELSRKSNLTYKEIAHSLSISEKTVHVQIVNALSRLKIKIGLLALLLL